MQVSYFPNKYNGKCSRCGVKVFENEGICFKTTKYECGCRNCYPLESAKVYADRDSAKAIEAFKQMELEARRVALVAERKALIEKLGLCLDSPFDTKTQQLSYSDYSEWKIPFNGEGTDEEFLKAIVTPSQSMKGQLRASGGQRLKEINREEGYVVLSESIQLCD